MAKIPFAFQVTILRLSLESLSGVGLLEGEGELLGEGAKKIEDFGVLKRVGCSWACHLSV